MEEPLLLLEKQGERKDCKRCSKIVQAKDRSSSAALNVGSGCCHFPNAVGCVEVCVCVWGRKIERGGWWQQTFDTCVPNNSSANWDGGYQIFFYYESGRWTWILVMKTHKHTRAHARIQAGSWSLPLCVQEHFSPTGLADLPTRIRPVSWAAVGFWPRETFPTLLNVTSTNAQAAAPWSQIGPDRRPRV